VRKYIGPYLLIAVLALAFFGELILHPTGVLYSGHSDLLAMHLPLKRFLVRSWQETGEIPLWNPYSFAGMPFVHDVQVAVFYPLHFPLYLLPEERIGAAMSWLVVLHIMIAGWCMYAYARWRNLDTFPALVAATGYMFGGKWLLHILAGGQYIMIPLAWLPLVLLLLERSIRFGSLLAATWTGVVFSFVIVGTHPQMTLYAGTFVAFWTLGCAFEGRVGSKLTPTTAARSLPVIFRWLLAGIWAIVIASGLSAIQLLPALDAVRESSRAEGVRLTEIFRAAGPSLLGVVGPGPSETWEDRSGLSVLWLAAALLPPFAMRGRARFEAFFGIALLAFAFGGAALVQWLPGFRLFQLPARMLILLSFPVAMLAGRATQLLLDPTESPRTMPLCRRLLIWTATFGLFLAVTAAWVDYRAWSGSQSQSNDPTPLAWLGIVSPTAKAYWLLLPVTASIAYWALGAHRAVRRPRWAAAWLGLLLVDLWSLNAFHVSVQSEAELYAPSQCVRYLIEAKRQAPQDRWRVLDPGLPGKPADAPLGAALPLLGEVQLEPVLGYNSFDLRRYKEFLQFTYGEDRPIVPRDGIFGYPIIADFAIKEKSLADLLGIRYLLRPVAELAAPEHTGDVTNQWQTVSGADCSPRAYSFLSGGIRILPPYAIVHNRSALPRAFKVHAAKPLGARAEVFDQLKTTDLRREALIEKPVPESWTQHSEAELVPAEITEYLPNRVTVRVGGGNAGILVLTDPWFTGWTCLVDGKPAEILRANFLFRGVMVPAGDHEVRFVFAPASYTYGKITSATTAALVVLATLICGFWRRRPVGSA
jgi:hypothetical protein